MAERRADRREARQAARRGAPPLGELDRKLLRALRCQRVDGRRGVDAISHLLAAGANPNAESSNGDTPLFCATGFGGWHAAIALLLAAGADPTHRNKAGQSTADLLRAGVTSAHEVAEAKANCALLKRASRSKRRSKAR